MSQENVDAARRFYDFWIDRDYSLVEGRVHPEAVVDVSRNVFNPAVHQGIDSFRWFVQQIDDVWEDFEVAPEEMIDAGDKVFVAHRIKGRGRAGGVETEMLLYGVFEFRDGKILRFTGGFRERSEALEAAGL